MARLINYLNTPHFASKDALTQCLSLPVDYDMGYLVENDPYLLLNTEKIAELSKGVEPVLYKETNNKRKAEVLQSLIWKDGEWRLE